MLISYIHIPLISTDHNFRSFLQQHIDQAFTKGFDDNVGRHIAPGYFEVTLLSA